MVATAVALGGFASAASAAVPHTVAPGETLWSIAAANNFTTRTVAAFNGLSEDAQVVAGETLEIPTVAEGAAALASVPDTAAAGSTSSGTSGDASSAAIPPAPGMGHVPSPWGPLHLTPAAADAWNAMRAEALRIYGVDLQPGGPMSAYRTYDQQAELYDLFLSGQGAPANPPGSSSHEVGTAVDVATPQMRQIIDEIGAGFGWGKVHAPGEWWHVDYVGG
jgi:murein DD-endopeptidase MepM/ murein hydrolase activator NlpD